MLYTPSGRRTTIFARNPFARRTSVFRYALFFSACEGVAALLIKARRSLFFCERAAASAEAQVERNPKKTLSFLAIKAEGKQERAVAQLFVRIGIFIVFFRKRGKRRLGTLKDRLPEFFQRPFDARARFGFWKIGQLVFADEEANAAT